MLICVHWGFKNSHLEKRQRFAVAHREGAVQRVSHFGLRGDAEGFEDCRVKIFRSAGLGGRVSSVFVRAAVDLATLDAGSGERDRMRVRVVVAAF